MAYLPINLPSFFRSDASLSIWVIACIFVRNSSRTPSYSVPATNSLANCASGATTIKVVPYIVSGLVVYTVTVLSISFILKSTWAPWLLPIQFFCISLTFSGHPSRLSRSESSSSENSVVLKYHCSSSFFSTCESHLSQHPSTTCSLARTVSHDGHQFTKDFFLYAKSFSKNFKNIFCVHL